MKRYALIAAGFVALATFAGCASTATQTPAQVLANVHMQAVKACAVATPTLASLEAMRPQLVATSPALATDLDEADKYVTLACSSTPTLASIQDLANYAMPLAIKIIAASPMADQDKMTAEIALTAASVAVSAALAQYAPVVAPTTPASAPIGASA